MKSYIGPDGRWCHRFRQSWLKEADTCPERARLTYEHQMPERETDAASLGTAAHAAFEACIEEAKHEGTPLDEETTVELYHRAFTELMADPNFRFVKYTEKSARKFGEDCVRTWYHEVLPDLDVDAAILEQSFVVPLVEDDERVIELSGTIDYREGHWGRDYKTSGRGEYTPWEYQRWNVQATAYTYAIHYLEDGEPETPMEFEFIVLHRKGVQFLGITRDEGDWEWLKQKCLAYARLIEVDLDVWPLQDNHALCSEKWCPAWKFCKGAHVDAA